MNRISRIVLTALTTVPMAFSSLASATEEPTASWSLNNSPVVGFETFPAYVNVVIDFPHLEGMTVCGGTLIANDAVLTAAECLRDTRPPLTAPYKPYPAEQLTVHHPLTTERMSVTAVHYPKPDAEFPFNKADLAILKLYAPLETDARVSIPTQGLPTIRSGQGMIFAAGASDTGPADDPSVEGRKLRKATVPFQQPSWCTSNPQIEPMLCAEATYLEDDQPHTCAGDPGSPLLYGSSRPEDAVQVGLLGAAWTMDTDAPLCGGESAMYTNLTDYSDWIASIVPTVIRKPYGKAPVGPVTPDPNRPLACGDVVSPGTNPPTELVDGMEWVPPRGPDVGSAISVAASELTWKMPSKEPARFVLLAGECAWADALPSNGLTHFGPLLLTDSNTLEPDVAAEIDRLKVPEVIIIGGPKAVSPAVEQALKAKGKKVRRLQGETRIETAVAVAEEATEGTQDLTVFVARAYPAPGGSPSQAFADSLGAAFGITDFWAPVLLTESDKLSAPTAKWIAKADPFNYYVLGGEQAVSKRVELALNPRKDPNVLVTRFAGNNRAHTAALLARLLIDADNAGNMKGLMILDSQGDDAWKTGFIFGGPAYHNHFVYGLAAGDEVPDETKDLIRLARFKKLNVYCVASAEACAKVRNTR